MVEIEKYPCKDSYEEDARVRYWVEQLHADVNTRPKTLLTKMELAFKTSGYVCICGSKV